MEKRKSGMKIFRRFIQMALLSLVLAMAVPAAFNLPGGVLTAQAASVKLSKKSATLIKGQTLKLQVAGTKKAVKWSSSKKSVATVNKNGKVTAKKKGTATITAAVNGKQYTCKVKVVKPELSETSLKMAAGDTEWLEILGTSKKVKWKSSDPHVAKVDEYGSVTALSKGSATITATVLGKSYKCKVKVNTRFSTAKALEGISYTTKENDSQVCCFIKNDYIYPVGLSGIMTFYDADGKALDLSSNYVSQVDAGKSFALSFDKPTDAKGKYVSYASFSIDWEVSDPTYSGQSNKAHAKLTYKTKKGSKALTVTVKNNSSKKVYYEMSVAFYKNDQFLWCDSYTAYDEIKAGKSHDLKFEYYYDYDDDRYVVPDRWEVYIG